MKIKVGQIWEEVDPRTVRKVRIEAVVSLDMPKGIQIRNVDKGSLTWASATRFNGRRGGYRLTEDVAG